jgi:glutamate carboxypeptidase
VDAWVESASHEIVSHAERELEALVAVSTPSGDVEGAEEAVALVGAFLPVESRVERLKCSSAAHAPDLCARLSGTGSLRVLLLGHLDTVIAHGAHRHLEREGDRLIGSGTVDMKGGVALALGTMRVLAKTPEHYAEVALLLVNDEEWRTSEFRHAAAFAGFDACLCFEAGQRAQNGGEAVVVKRKAAGTLRVEAIGSSAHSGSAPDKGRSALLALAVTAQRIAERHDPNGPERLTAVPTIIRSGEAFNVVPAHGELVCDLRAERLAAFEPVLKAVPEEVGGARLEPYLVRAWPGMDTRDATRDLLAHAGERLGRTIVGAERGGASDASHMAAHIPLTVDGLGPRGGGAHTPAEWVSAESLRSRAEVAVAVVSALISPAGTGAAPG